MAKVIGIRHEDGNGGQFIEWHASGYGSGADYDSLCGCDGDDARAGTFGTVTAPRGRKITCPACFQMWSDWRRYRRADFDGGEGKP